MPVSQNGYEVLDKDTSGPWPHLREWTIPGVKRRILLRDGSAGFLLIHLALWFDQVLEDIDQGVDDWGWSPRKISGSSSWSNHASGTAMDLNATKHPQGQSPSRSFSTQNITAIHTRLALYKSCLKWGGDYRTTKDSMHWEIDRGSALVVKMAQSLVDSPRGKAVLSANPGAREIIL